MCQVLLLQALPDDLCCMLVPCPYSRMSTPFALAALASKLFEGTEDKLYTICTCSTSKQAD